MIDDKRKKFKKRVYFKVILITLILVITLVISFIFVREMKKESNDLVAERIAAQTILVRNESMAGLSKEYEKAIPYIEKSQKIHFVVAPGDVVTIISLLEKIAQDTGSKQTIQLKNVEPAPAISALGVSVNKMNYTITLDGSYNSFLEYVKKVAELIYYIKIDSINMSGPVDVEKNSQTVIGASFYIKK